MIYSLLQCNRGLSIRLIFPLIILGYLSWCYKSGNEENLENWGGDGFIYFPFVRGVAEMSIGVVLAYVYINYKKNILRLKYLWDFITVLGIIIYILIFTEYKSLSNYVFLIFPVLIISSWQKGSVLNVIFKYNLWGLLGKLSYDMFLIHAFVYKLCRHFFIVEFGINKEMSMMAYLIVLIISASLYDRLCNIIQNGVRKKLNLVSN